MSSCLPTIINSIPCSCDWRHWRCKRTWDSFAKWKLGSGEVQLCAVLGLANFSSRFFVPICLVLFFPRTTLFKPREDDIVVPDRWQPCLLPRSPTPSRPRMITHSSGASGACSTALSCVLLWVSLEEAFSSWRLSTLRMIVKKRRGFEVSIYLYNF